MRTVVIIEDSQAEIGELKRALQSLASIKIIIIGVGVTSEEKPYMRSEEEIFSSAQTAAMGEASPIFLVDERLGYSHIDQKDIRGSVLIPTLRQMYPEGIFICISSHPPRGGGPYDGIICKYFYHEEYEREKFRQALQEYL